MHMSVLVNQRQEESKWGGKEAIRHFFRIFWGGREAALKNETDWAMHAQTLPYAPLFQIDFTQAINANQALIILTQEEVGGFAISFLLSFN